MRLTCLIPAFNAEPFIAEALGSVLAQRRQVDEILVVDDGSTDRTAEIAERWGARVVRLPGNRGAGAARNRGAELARGEVLLWLDADD